MALTYYNSNSLMNGKYMMVLCENVTRFIQNRLLVLEEFTSQFTQLIELEVNTKFIYMIYYMIF